MDFGQPISYTQPRPVEESPVLTGQPTEPAKESPAQEQEFEGDSILPNFLSSED